MNNVLLTSPDLQKAGGVASYCRMLQPFLGNDVDYFTIGNRNDNKKVVPQALRLLYDFIRFFFKFGKGRYNLVHLNTSLGNKALLRDGLLLLIAKSRGRKVLVFIHGWDEVFENIVKSKYLPLFQRVYFQADAFVVLANEFKGKLLAMKCDKPIYVETTTVDDGIFSLQKKIPNSDFFQILFLARVERGKGIYETLDAYHQVKARHPQVTLLVAGDGSELVKAKIYTKERGIVGVEFCGYVTGSRKNAVFCDADLFLFPTSYGEGMPINVLEAMACGIPVITRPVGGLRDFFEDGCMGFISETKDPAFFAEMIERLIVDRNLALRMSAYNRAYAVEHFSLSKVAGRIHNIYAQLIQPKVN
jgi:glycosyltransferase involved in cell wall biosynthesis